MGRDIRPDDLPAWDYASMDLADFIEKASGESLQAPHHLGDFLDTMRGLHGKQLRICVSCPPQHGKTTLVLYAIVLTLLRNPKLRFAYASHGQLFSEEQSRIMRDLYVACGGRLKADFNTVKQWKTEEGGGLIAVSHESSLIGRRVDVLVCDDLIKDAEMAENAGMRERIWRWFHGVATQRLWVGASVVVIGSRWHYDDPSGRLIAKGYREINMPAVRVDEHGNERALWPDVKPLEWLNTLRQPSSVDYVGEHEWQAAYQGKPVPRTGALFGPPRWYEHLPAGAVCVAVGVDVATSSSADADWAVAVALFQHGATYYVDRVWRIQMSMVEVKRMLEEAKDAYPKDTRMVSYVSGPEKGILNLLFHDGIPIERLPAKFSKWTRSQKCAIAWRTGRVLVRMGQPWSHKFAREVEFFTGREGAVDDQVDALVSAFDLIEANAPVEWAGSGFKFGAAVV